MASLVPDGGLATRRRTQTKKVMVFGITIRHNVRKGTQSTFTRASTEHEPRGLMLGLSGRQAAAHRQNYCEICGDLRGVQPVGLFSVPVLGERSSSEPLQGGLVRVRRARTYDLNAVRFHHLDVCSRCSREWRRPAWRVAPVAALSAAAAVLSVWLGESALNGLEVVTGLLPPLVYVGLALLVFAVVYGACLARHARPTEQHARARAERIMRDHSRRRLHFGWARDYPRWRAHLDARPDHTAASPTRPPARRPSPRSAPRAGA